MNWDILREFLRTLGVDWETSTASHTQAQEEPLLTIFQKASDHEAFYRIDWLEAVGPELLVLLPDHLAPLKFHFYRVHMSEMHPLAEIVTQLMRYQSGVGFEHSREVHEWHTFCALIESIKALFWMGYETSSFPVEITVEKIC